MSDREIVIAAVFLLLGIFIGMIIEDQKDIFFIWCLPFPFSTLIN